ncbi:hypothetical protein [Paenibacillus alginolyticus]|uniref:hypothetical protein n=1 Tax=Paenibacillus alginolyticus TaxID=59839 RepID=UPI0035E44D49
MVGQSYSSCIYFALDVEATISQMPTIIEYIRAASEATPTFTTGFSGSYVEAVNNIGCMYSLLADKVGVTIRYWTVQT